MTSAHGSPQLNIFLGPIRWEALLLSVLLIIITPLNHKLIPRLLPLALYERERNNCPILQR